MTDTPKKPKKPSRQQVYTLLVQIGRKSGDGLPKGATGAALMCFASGVDEAEAVRETEALLKQAETAPLDVTGYGTLEDTSQLPCNGVEALDGRLGFRWSLSFFHIVLSMQLIRC